MSGLWGPLDENVVPFIFLAPKYLAQFFAFQPMFTDNLLGHFLNDRTSTFIC